MSFPVLYSSTEKEFKTQGLGVLSDAIKCIVTEERNGSYELEMIYPVSGIHYDGIKLSAQILAVPADSEMPQPFRIYKISKPIGGKVTILAEHISYQLTCIPVMPFEASNCVEAMQGLVANAAEDCPFTVYTDKSITAAYKQTEPASFRSRLAGTSGGILDLYGPGDFKFDRYQVSFLAHRGKDRGVTIEYGKNLTDLKQEESIENTVTGIVPFWKSSDKNAAVVTLPEKVVESSNADKFPFKRTIVHDFSSDFQDQPTVDQLREKAESYVKSILAGVPSVDLNVSFVNLADTEEYKDLASERISLCDTVTVRFPALGVETKAKVVKTVWDVLADRYESISLSSSGSTREDLSKTINDIAKVADEKLSVSYLDAAIKYASDLINGGLGGHVVINYVNGYPSEVCVMDTDSISTAKNVIRINQNGIGFSNNGYNGPFNTAWTIDGKFNADFIISGIINANLIKAGVIQDTKGLNWWNLESGEVHISAVDSLGKLLSDAKSEWQQTANGISQTVSSNYERTVTGQREEFAQGDSDTTAPVNGWSTTQPTRKDGKYIWRRTVTTFGDGTTSTSPGVCITGPKGDSGATGLGISSSTITYAVSSSGTDAPASGWSSTIPSVAAGSYLWTRTAWTYTDGASTTTYSVARQGVTGPKGDKGDKGDTGARGLQGIQGEKGEQGVPGKDGTNGKTSYFHIKYSAVAKPTSSSQLSETPSDYIGTYVDFNESDSTDPSKYTWSQFKGSQGPKGDKGIAGSNGINGKTSYLHIAYATSSDGKTGFSVSESSGKTYIGQYTDFTESDSTDYTKYSWTLIKGEKGDKGDKGDKGATGERGPQGAQGLQGPKGDQGIQGIQGPKGTDGTTYYTHIAYASSADGKTGFSVSSTSNAKYLGVYVDSTSTDSTDPTKYKWTLIKGADGPQGIQGKAGSDGRTPYIHFAYANSADGKTGFNVNYFANALYVGTYTDYTATDSTNYASYAWARLKGDTGATGPKGDTGPQGPTGAKGADGKGIKSTAVTYQAAPTQTVTPTGTWSGSVPSLSTSNPYLWTRTVITYTDNTTSTSYSVSSAITDPRINSTIIKHEQEYYLSTSDTSLAGGSWSTTFPTRKDGTFYWVRYKDTHANNAVTYDPSANGKLLTEVNEVWNSVVSNQTAINSSNAQINMVATSVTSVKNDLGKKADTDSVNSSMDKLSGTVTDIGKQIADLKVKASSIEASVTEVNNLAQTTKKATAALTANGLSVDTGQTTKSVVDGTGLTITSKADNSVVAKFTTGESEIQNLKIDGFMKIGAHVVQKMQDAEWDGTTVNGTGWMWNGG